MNLFPQRKTLTSLQNKLYAHLKGKEGEMEKLRVVLLYGYKFILYTYIKKTDHIARKDYGTLCNNLHGKRTST